MIPPIWMSVRVNWMIIPIPLVLLWPVFILTWIILGLVLTAVLLGVGAEAAKAGKIWVECWHLLCGLRDTSVEVEHPHTHVKIAIV